MDLRNALLVAAVSQERRRCIGIALLQERYAYACEQSGLTVPETAAA
jgi:hypothetical protein